MIEQQSNLSSPTIPELLAPAGNYEKLVTAVHYGADAVYLGGRDFSLRAKAGNFALEAMQAGIDYAHKRGVKVYVTVNIFAHNQDLQGLAEYLPKLAARGVDGIIVADPGVLALARSLVPELAIHLSTQANVTNAESAAFWLSQGVQRLNLARELSFAEIQGIRTQVDGELEVFVHGALCISYSGRCLLSNYLTGRDANQGSCAHPCRFSYSLVEEKRPGEFFPVEEDDRGTYIFNSKDLCLLDKLPLLVAAGVNSLKIEGRMKSIFYVGSVVRLYRTALDFLRTLPAEEWLEPEKICLPEGFFAEASRIGTRGMTENFFAERPGSSEMIYRTSRAEQGYEPVAVVHETGTRLVVEMRNTTHCGETIECMSTQNIECIRTKIVGFTDLDGNSVDKAHPGNMLVVTTQPALENVREHTILRRKKRGD
ncbi:MAG: peptidase U32 [Deltaproteobacteria bacterium]|nr:MAG: peptidase U32 [Deltaproteobacteria bacterium]